MKILQRLAGGLAVLSVILVLLITAIEIAAYSDFGYYEREYGRLGVLNDVPMEMEDLMDVTHEMLSYLRGGRDDLVVETVIDGKTQEFFNEQEKFHMNDCRQLFLGGILLRRIGIILLICSVLFLIFTGRREMSAGGPSVLSRILPVYFQRGTLFFLIVLAILAGLFASDFTKYFTVFHKIFFRNDQWLFDPAVSRLINIVPEPFWSAMALRCAMFFAGLMALAFTGFSLWHLLLAKTRRLKAAPAALFMAAVLALQAALPVRAAGVPGELLSIAEPETTAAAELPAPADISSTPGWPEKPDVEGEGAILMEAKTGKILYSKNSKEAYYPASITKLMTALLTLENCDLSDIVTFSYRATHELEEGSTHIARTEGEEMSVRDCLYALLLYSANEVAQALAEHISGTIEDFASLMNERAAQLGCSNTHFTNPSGLNSESHYTCCRDMAIITRACVQNPDFLEIESANSYTIPATNKHEEALTIAQKHKLVKQGEDHYDGAIAGKTGYTSIAGNTLVTYAVRGDMELICVVMKCAGTHYTDTVKLLNWGFDNFSMLQLSMAEHPERLGAGLPEGLIVPENEWLVLPREMDFESLEPRVDLLNGMADENGNRPAGRVHYFHEDSELGTATLLLPPSAAPTEAPTTVEVPTAAPETQAEAETKAAGLQKVKQTLQNIPRPSQETVIMAVAFMVDHWQITLGILVGLLLFLLLFSHRHRSAKKRKKRNYRYGGYTSTKRTRRKGNKYTMRMRK